MKLLRNNALMEVREHRGIEIETPREFLEIMKDF